MPSQSEVFTVTEQKNLSWNLSFSAQSCVVDNLTASWLYITGASRPVPPWTWGAILPMTNATTVGSATWSTPAGIQAAAAGSTNATITFLSDHLPPSNGQQVVIPSQQVPLPVTKVVSVSGAGSSATVGSATVNVGSGSNSSVKVWVSVPPGANSLIVSGGESVSAGTNAFNATVIGQTTGAQYLTGTTVPAACIISQAADATVIVTITNAGGDAHPNSFVIVASYGTQAVAVQSNGAALPVVGQSTDENGSAAFLETAPGPLGIPFFKTSVANTSVSITLGPPATTGHFVRLSELAIGWSGAPTGPNTATVSDSVGNLWQGVVSQQFPPPYTFPIPLTTGNDGSTGSLTITLSASGSVGIAGILCGVYAIY